MEKESESYYTWKPLNTNVLINGYNPGVFLLGCVGMVLIIMFFITTFNIAFLLILIGLFYYFIILGLKRSTIIRKVSDRKGEGDIEAPEKKKYLEGIPKKYVDTDNVLNYLIKDIKND